jgi:hypothetical protein
VLLTSKIPLSALLLKEHSLISKKKEAEHETTPCARASVAVQVSLAAYFFSGSTLELSLSLFVCVFNVFFFFLILSSTSCILSAHRKIRPHAHTSSACLRVRLHSSDTPYKSSVIHLLVEASLSRFLFAISLDLKKKKSVFFFFLIISRNQCFIIVIIVIPALLSSFLFRSMFK